MKVIRLKPGMEGCKLYAKKAGLSWEEITKRGKELSENEQVYWPTSDIIDLESDVLPSFASVAYSVFGRFYVESVMVFHIDGETYISEDELTSLP